MKRLSLLGLVLLAMVSPTGCRQAESAPAAKSVVVLMDASASTAGEQVRAAYVQAMDAIVATLKPGDALCAGWISDRSAGELTLPMLVEIPLGVPARNNNLYREAAARKADEAACIAIEEARARIRAELQREHRKVNDTHIMTSLVLAERALKKLARPRRIVVLLSDMLEDSDRLDFDEINLTAAERNKIVENERTSGRLPDLAGSRIYVVGATSSDDDRVLAVRAFWMDYFKAAGAELLAENYGPLIKFENDVPLDCAD